ncbi:thioredoxin domain-containing protein [Ferruginibacter sp.]|uniref:thioredoxin domain-containing protein n=1 Tax=Ferruginibacter sp. TaxID=1940288 RepID=UPI0019A161AC|nr:thioredoxin domain-containing protein [Ferruginibacter sp.]MBC7629649.1 thioredoxin domain-containing protein [Ferruginibacter sp.]
MMRRIHLIISLAVILTNSSCGQTGDKKTGEEKQSFSNHLIHESSPYLLMHAHNPVNWYPWGQEAFDKAKKENKPVIISIGYAACHWCHVMEKESYSDTAVARLMNENFVAIKVDREERPDVDQVYMNAAQLINGNGGWPLNAIALPDGRPIYAATYFPKKDWMSLLKQMLTFVKQNPEKAEQQAEAVAKGIRGSELVKVNTSKPEYKLTDLNSVFNNWKKNIDFINGGNNGAPKFPMPVGSQFLLQYYFLTKNEEALKAVKITLNKMAAGGIYDHVGGGFARYSTDAVWKVPHFEKMLYDNAQLTSLYASAYQLTKDPLYKNVVYETLEFIGRELTSPEGGFYSSLDADSDGEEGRFYVWTKDEIKKILGDDAALAIDYFNVTEKGNWEGGKNILYQLGDDNTIAKKYNITSLELSKRITGVKKILLAERAKRIRPGLDDKILTAWNALMIKGYTDAYRVFGEQRFLDAALKNAAFILKNAQSNDNRLNRNFKNGKSSINAFLDDYAFTIDAFIALYQSTFDEKWLKEAHHLLEYTLAHFYDAKSGMFYYTSDKDPALIARKMEIADNVIPSSNSAMAKNLFMLGEYFYKDDYIHKASAMLNNVKQDAVNGNAYYANWDILMAWLAAEPFEVAIVGNDYASKRKEIDTHYLPNIFLSGGNSEGSLSLLEGKLVPGKTTIYVCRNKSCKLPTTEVSKAVEQILK